jgi:pSer/pThr/pTyr-binding forkhead associated (FHA) protein
MPELYLGPVPTNDRLGSNDSASIVITRFPCMLGRNTRCDERIDNLTISRQHCRFTLRDGRVWVEDLGSRNGTGLNGERLNGAQPLTDGDVFQVGHLAFQVRLQNAPVASLVSPLPLTAPAETNLPPSHSQVACDAAARS